MDIKEKITKAYEAYKTKHGMRPTEVEVEVSFNTRASQKETVQIWLGDRNAGNGVYFYACNTLADLLHLCDNGNGEQFMITDFIKFIERPIMKLYGFIGGKIREVHVTELKTFIHSNIADSNGGEVSINKLSMKVAGIDNMSFNYNSGCPSANNLPKYMRLFRNADTLQGLLETDSGLVLDNVFTGWEDEPNPSDCPIVKLDKSMYYRSTDIEQEFFDALPDNMFYEECHGVKTVCSWRWNGYKPVHEPVSEDENDITFDAINQKFNLNTIKNMKWYATEEECRADNKIEIVRF